ncbi:pyrroloquinoline quinone biosynthesis protein PqqD [Prauserella marina]|uniref:Pyrroloquinoline quinone biosynthesis protein D n=1 Tax=Prauserella marina TaxID=530584 RepID=A0A222VWU7_9PSEU|nr:pyrroloquinoline quinone biosynthesis peptide chaperone PqqD [Prauserella marina]ASR38409.1 pyrroloquinoline quinone biosynthesis protein PqqD [Prauserella marina]PWV78358.1 pyrroloquinoline quinone biosynthesis protein D [Prauserella marina]SDC84231.1 pyrroloquinoline quinone biosynthesis protein D [Prauserella marina]
MKATAARPRLRRGVRLSFDKVRERDVVLLPEGVLVLNPTAAAVLALCDGGTPLTGIVAALSERYRGVSGQDVHDVLARLADRQVIEWV